MWTIRKEMRDIAVQIPRERAILAGGTANAGPETEGLGEAETSEEEALVPAGCGQG